MGKRRSSKGPQAIVTVVVLSGGSGHTADGVLRAVAAQFAPAKIEVQAYREVRSSRQARQVVALAAQENAVLLHTLVEPKIRELVAHESNRLMVPTVDLLGPALAVLQDRLGTPRGRPGLTYTVNKHYFDRVDAMDFALAHDDGAGLHNLHLADVVLTGVSRVAKSVVCYYLAYRGIRAANVPLVLNSPPPQQLLKLPSSKVVGLTINAQRLQALRTTRLTHDLGHPCQTVYNDAERIADELREARHLMSVRGWPVIDVSYKPIEEIAQEVLALAKIHTEQPA